MKNLRSKSKLSLVLFMLTISIASFGSVKIQNFSVFGKQLSLEVPDKWQSVNKEIGTPLKLLGPIHEGRRPVITVVPIDLKNEKLTLEDAKNAQQSYKVSRLSWLQKFNGKAISFKPINVYTRNSNQIHKFGYTYTFNNINFSENSYYVQCKGKVIHMKTLVQLEHGEKWDRLVAQITDSLRCK